MFKKFTLNIIGLGATLSCLLLAFSCDSSTPLGSNISLTEVAGQGIDPDFKAIVDRFEVEANARGISVNLNGLDIQYGETDGAYGICFDGSSTKDIVINPILRTSDDDLVSEIILHELGHCILDRNHASNPNSIMHATNIIGRPWRTSVLDELFGL